MFDSSKSTEGDTSDEEPEAARASGDEHSDGSKTRVLTSIVGSAEGALAEWRWRVARDVDKTIRRIRRVPAGGVNDAWRRGIAAKYLESTGPNGQTGAFGQLRGHLFEVWDIRDYNLHHSGRLKQVRNSCNPTYDAIRIDKNGKFAGAVQFKSGPSGIGKAINKMESRKPGSASKATFRVPSDRADACRKAAGGRTRVAPSRLKNKTIVRRAKAGLSDIRVHGSAATSLRSQAVRAARQGALGATVINGLGDLGPFVHHDLNARQFVARRGVDAAEAGIAAAASTVTTAAITAMVATCTVTASAVVLPPAAGVAVCYGVSLVAKPARRYVTDRLRSHTDEESAPSVVSAHRRAD